MHKLHCEATRRDYFKSFTKKKSYIYETSSDLIQAGITVCGVMTLRWASLFYGALLSRNSLTTNFTTTTHDGKQNIHIICTLLFSVNNSRTLRYTHTQPLIHKLGNEVRQGKQQLETCLRKANVTRSSRNKPAFAAVLPGPRQLRDGSVDRTETYEPLSGKVMLGR